VQNYTKNTNSPKIIGGINPKSINTPYQKILESDGGKLP
jgi:hypothetical protein